MKSTVHFAPARASSRRNAYARLAQLVAATEPAGRFSAGDLVAVKVHWGEPGNTAFVPSFFVREVVTGLKELGVRPFVTDSNTLYRGRRHDALANLEAARDNGFTAETLGCPVVVADGLRGTDYREVGVAGRHLSSARIAAAIVEADGMVVISHVKGHMVFGFGGAVKNLGMGCAAAPAKQLLHADVRPTVAEELCTGCGQCQAHCRFGALALVDGGDGKLVAHIDQGSCSGCGECLVVCPREAIPINWEGDPATTQEKTAEYALAAVAGKEGRCLYLNFLTAITPDCDCCDWSDAPLVPDIGYLAATDPVAIDLASLDLINQGQGRDLFRSRRDIDYRPLLDHAAALGLGSLDYRLVRMK